MKKHANLIVPAFLCFTLFLNPSAAVSETKIDSVYPLEGTAGQDLEITIQGTGLEDVQTIFFYRENINDDEPVGLWRGDIRYPQDVVITGNTAFVVDENRLSSGGGSSGRLVILDVSSPDKPVRLGSVDTWYYAEKVAIKGDMAYLAALHGLQIIDVGNPEHPVIRSEMVINDDFFAYDVATGENVLILGGRRSLQMIDISNPDAPVSLGSVAMPGEVSAIEIDGNTAFVTNSDYGHQKAEYGLTIIDFSNPKTPKVIGSVATPGEAPDVARIGDIAYIADGSGGFVEENYGVLQVVDISNPANPVIINGLILDSPARSISISGNTAYVSGNDHCNIIDISTPAHPADTGKKMDYNQILTVSGNTAYGWSGYGMDIIDISEPQTPVRIRTLYAMDSIEDVEVSGNIVLAADWARGLKVIDAGNPADPACIGAYSKGYSQNSAYDIEVLGNTVLIANKFCGLLAVDISDPVKPALTGASSIRSYSNLFAINNSTAIVPFNQKGVYRGFVITDIRASYSPEYIETFDSYEKPCADSLSDITLSEDLMLAASFTNGLQIMDISNINDPVCTGSVTVSGSVFQVAVAGKTAFAAVDGVQDENGLLAADISVPSEPAVIGLSDIPINGYPQDLIIRGDKAYYVAYDSSETDIAVLDIRNPADPVINGIIETSGNVKSIAVKDDQVIAAKGSDGLQLIPHAVIRSIQVENENAITLTLPAPTVPGNYRLQVSSTGGGITEMSGVIRFIEPEPDEPNEPGGMSDSPSDDGSGGGCFIADCIR